MYTSALVLHVVLHVVLQGSMKHSQGTKVKKFNKMLNVLLVLYTYTPLLRCVSLRVGVYESVGGPEAHSVFAL